MAIGKELFDIIYSIRHDIKGKKVVSLGNPYISNVVIKKYFAINKFDFKNTELNDLSEYIFKTCFNVQSFNIIDITDEEKADFIHNLNFQINNDLINKFDFVIDPGTSEHIFDDSQGLSNIFKLLKKNGIYLFNLPSNSFLEHGFRQYSPTYFYDMCASNKGKLLLGSLGLSCTWLTLDCVPLYKRYDKNFEKVIDSGIYNNIRVFSNFGFKTGLIMRLINKLGSPTMINGLIKKRVMI